MEVQSIISETSRACLLARSLQMGLMNYGGLYYYYY